MSYYIFDDAGFVTGTYSGPGQPANSTDMQPPADARKPLQFVGGTWAVEAATPNNRFITYLAFLSRFTGSERAMVRALQSQDINVADFLMLVQAAKFIDLDDPRVAGGIEYFSYTSIITHDRAIEIISSEITESERP